MNALKLCDGSVTDLHKDKLRVTELLQDWDTGTQAGVAGITILDCMGYRLMYRSGYCAGVTI